MIKIQTPAEPIGEKRPIDRPCSACSAGDSKMEYHNHYPPFRAEPVVGETKMERALVDAGLALPIPVVAEETKQFTCPRCSNRRRRCIECTAEKEKK